MSTQPPPLAGAAPAGGPAVRCPVCGAASHGDHCGWTATGPLVAGPVTAAAREELRTALERDRRAHRLRAAVRALAGLPEGARTAWGPRLMELAAGPGGPPVDPAERHTAVAETAVAPSGDDPVPALRAVAEGERPHATLAVLDADGLHLTPVTAARGRLRAPDTRTLDWATLLPALPSEPARAAYVLAGGPLDDGTGPAPHLDDTATAALPGLTDRTGDLVVVSHLPGWPYAETLIDKLRALNPTGPTRRAEAPADAEDTVTELLASVPPAVSPALVLTRHDPLTDLYVIEPVPLFAGPGARPGHAERVTARAPEGPPGATRVPLTLAVVDLTDRPRETWQVLTAVDIEVPPGEPVDIDVVLEPDGGLRLTVDGRAAHTRSALTWAQLLDRVDRAHAGHSLHIVLLIEVGGAHNTVRVDSARWVLEAARRARPDDILRVSVRPYWDHEFARLGTADPGGPPYHVPDEPPKPLATTFEQLAQLRKVTTQVHYPYASALEDSLARLPERPLTRDGEEALFVVASRPPFSDPPDLRWGGFARPCPAGLDWRAVLRATGGPRWLTRTLLVVEQEHEWDDFDERRALRAAKETWRQIAEDGWDVVELPAHPAVDPYTEADSYAAAGSGSGATAGAGSGSGVGSGVGSTAGSGEGSGEGSAASGAQDTGPGAEAPAGPYAVLDTRCLDDVANRVAPPPALAHPVPFPLAPLAPLSPLAPPAHPVPPVPPVPPASTNGSTAR